MQRFPFVFMHSSKSNEQELVIPFFGARMQILNFLESMVVNQDRMSLSHLMIWIYHQL
jgi:hypothetical protein